MGFGMNRGGGKTVRALIWIGAPAAFIGLLWALQLDGGEAGGPSYPEKVSVAADWATIILVFVAVGALAYAAKEVSAAHTANHLAYLQSKATFLLEVDRRWDSQEMVNSRSLIRTVRDDLMKLVASKYSQLDDAHKAEKLGDEFAKALAEMRKNDPNNYVLMLRYCGFFETVGVMVQREYIPLDDIDALFRGPILAVDTCLRSHISQRQNETGVPKGLFEHALFLADEIKQIPQD